jgi:outer membrane protein assembly factor BamB
VLWRADLGGGPKPANGQISGQVLAAGGVVYATSVLTGRVYAYRAADGARLWSVSLPNGALTKAQPDLADGLLLVGASDGGLYGLDPATGAVRLRLPLPGPVSAGGMLVIDGHVAVLTANGDFALLQLAQTSTATGSEGS